MYTPLSTWQSNRDGLGRQSNAETGHLMRLIWVRKLIVFCFGAGYDDFQFSLRVRNFQPDLKRSRGPPHIAQNILLILICFFMIMIYREIWAPVKYIKFEFFGLKLICEFIFQSFSVQPSLAQHSVITLLGAQILRYYLFQISISVN